ncbi:glycosyltransferase 87 family protein [Aestuariimicrobium soli]|uniref:glycosyltransferase 87 family protein n=1 Tax=Aestuariimicrobium soli TaxID=2035834 RepID=UPI003EBEF721
MLAGAVGVALRFPVKRFWEETQSDYHPDFDFYFLPAGQAILRGESPWTVTGYVHPPVTALLAVASDLLPGDDPYIGFLAALVLTGTLVCALAVWPLSARLRVWQQATVLVGASVTLWSSRPTIRMLFLGQTDIVILLGIMLSAALCVWGRAGFSGAALTLGAWVKLWPGISLVWLLRRRLPDRRRAVLAAAASLGVMVVSALAFGGPRAILQWIRGVRDLANQGGTSYSALGAGEALFSDVSPYVQSLTVSPTLVILTTVLLSAVAVALIALCLWWVDDAVITLLSLVPLCLILLSVSQYTYQMLALPLAWYWASTVLAEPRQPRHWVALVAAGAWWLAMFAWVPSVDHLHEDGTPVLTSGAYLLQFGAFLGFLAVSVLVAVLDARSRQASPRPMPWESRSAAQPSDLAATLQT